MSRRGKTLKLEEFSFKKTGFANQKFVLITDFKRPKKYVTSMS